ncbi:SDR family oxidoreductase [Tomitella gaofuii]|uniref:SDR family oxidoreductase n=1 Tax=Tomitella gaofuii TaxID=2760083 RepID=UPI0015FA125F|nr:SDR family oxidoreductase [Tomitella gaofuii]
MFLQDKVLIVTGVGPGMGSKLCRIAAEQGASVAVSARSEGFISELVEELHIAGHDAIAVPTDVSDDYQCRRLAAATVEAFGRIDGLVNSARSRTRSRQIEQADLASWPPVMDVTCFGALRMSLAVLPTMKAQQDGAIVNVGTISTVWPGSGEANYAVAKAALGGLTRHMAAEFAQYNIRVNHTRMGVLWGASIQRLVRTRAKDEGRTEQDIIDDFIRNIPLGLIPPDDECAKSVLFFVSDLARMVTGATLDINGGQYMAP